MNKEIKQNQTYLSPKVTVVAFKIEGGFAPSIGGAEMGTQAYEEIEVDNNNTETGWGSGSYI